MKSENEKFIDEFKHGIVVTHEETIRRFLNRDIRRYFGDTVNFTHAILPRGISLEEELDLITVSRRVHSKYLPSNVPLTTAVLKNVRSVIDNASGNPVVQLTFQETGRQGSLVIPTWFYEWMSEEDEETTARVNAYFKKHPEEGRKRDVPVFPNIDKLEMMSGGVTLTPATIFSAVPIATRLAPIQVVIDVVPSEQRDDLFSVYILRRTSFPLLDPLLEQWRQELRQESNLPAATTTLFTG